MNKFLQSSSSGISEERVREIVDETAVVYNNDSSVSINNSSNASLYTLPTVGGVAGNSVVVGADGKHLVFANAGSNGLTNPLTDVLNANGNSIVQIYRLQGQDMKDLAIDSNVDMLNYSIKNLTSIRGSGGKLEILNSNLHMNGGNIYNASSIVGAGLTNDLLISGSITLNGDINMANFTLNNVRNVSKSDLNLSLIPATAGSAGQVLTRASNFNINDPLTAQLVWTDMKGGDVTNPMLASMDFQGGIKTNSINLSSGTIIQTSPLAVNTQLKTNVINPLTNPSIVMGNTDINGTLKADTIQPLSGTDISINGNLSFVQNIPVLSSPNGLRIRVAEIYNTGLVTSFLGDCVFSNVVLFANGIETNTIKQRTGTALALTSPTISISGSTAINLTGPTNFINNATFQQSVKTNTIDTYTGGNISCLQNLTLAVGKQLKSTLMFSDGLRSNTTDLYIAGLLPDNKTQSNIIITSPQISFDNQFGPLVQDTQVNIAGSLIFNNPATNPLITGSNLIIRGRTPLGVATDLTLSGVTTTIDASTLQISSTLNNNITGQTNFDRNINLLSTRGININPSMVLYRTYGIQGGPFNITSSSSFVLVTDGQTAKGTKVIPANGFIAGDLYKLTLKGLLSTSATGNIDFNVYVGINRACVFSFPNTAMNFAGFEFSCELTMRASSPTTSSLYVGLGKLDRDNFKNCSR